MKSIRLSVRGIMALVAVAGLMLGGWRLRQRSEHYRKQAALSAYYELDDLWSAEHALDEGYRIGENEEEWKENGRALLVRSRRHGVLKEAYRRLARHPWEMHPADAPASLEATDLDSYSAAEIEEMSRDHEK